MTSHAKLRKAMKVYRCTRDNGNTERDQESQALAFLVSQLQKAQANPDMRQLYFDALYYNQRMWAALRASALDPEHELPDSIKSNMIDLSLFVDRHTSKLLHTYMPDELDILVDINRCLSLGLQGVPPENTPAGIRLSSDDADDRQATAN